MKKALKISGIVIGGMLLVLVLFPLFFKDRIQKEIKTLANRNLNAEINWSDMHLSFFSHFPHLTFTLDDLILRGSRPFEKDTLISAHQISFGVDLLSLFKDKFLVTRIYFEKAIVNILYNEKGESDLDIMKPAADSTSAGDTASSGVALRIENIFFKDCRIVYADPSIPVKVIAGGFNYKGTSDMTEDVLFVGSEVSINSLDVIYGNEKYLDSKPLKADLRTRINTKNLSIRFEKNDIMVKDIPMKIQGKFDFEKDGYNLFIHFSSVMDKEYLTATFKLRQTSTLWMFAKADARIDLEKWTRAFGLESADVKGQYVLKLRAEGPYLIGPDTTKIRKDTIILSIPNFDLTSELTGGYIRYKDLPHALEKISMKLNAASNGNDYRNISLHLDDLDASFLKNKLSGYFRLNRLQDFDIDAGLTGSLNLAELKQVVPLDSMELSGMLDFAINSKGRYAPEKRLFPVTTATIDLKDGMVKSSYYPHPIEEIQLHSEVLSREGTMKDLQVKILPLTFLFEGEKFTLTAALNDFDDLNYDVKSNGVIDLGKVYHVFSQKGTDLDGYIQTDLSLKGRQSDATSGRYEKLQNSGTLILSDIRLSSELFPLPFIIRTGNFRFDRDKIWFDNFLATYSSSDFRLKGAVSNILNYALSKGGTLKGDFQLRSDFVNVDDFMAFAVVDSAEKEMVKEETGVVILPTDLDINFNTEIKRIAFQGLDIRDFHGELDLKEGIMVLKNTGFNLIDCKVSMNATYGSITPEKAFFEFGIKAEDFDVKRAYNEIAMFRDLASAAENAEGIISLDYSIKGRLGADMYPIMPSLEGGGTVSLKKVKVSGFKLFNDISKKTEKEGISNPDMSKVEIRSTIKKNVITLEQFKFKVSGIRFRISGTTTFDSRVNLKIRLGLPPMGIIGINMKVFGPMEDLKFKFGKGKDVEETQETDYSDELSPEMKAKIRAAKDDEMDEL